MTDKLKTFIHVYTGDGKGKTTAALGLALRAIGAGMKVIILQFMKQPVYSEHKAIEKYKLPIKIESFGIGYYKILGDRKPQEKHIRAAEKALIKTAEIISSKKYDVIILDEINTAIGFGLIDVDDVIAILKSDQESVTEIVLTGRRAHPKLIKTANLVTEMKLVKHYFDKGRPAKKGIEY